MANKKNNIKRTKFRGANKIHKKIDASDLAKKLGVTPKRAREIIAEDGRRTAIDKDGKTMSFNYKEENPIGLLREHFGIHRVSNEKISSDVAIFPKLDAAFLKIVQPEERVQVSLRIIAYLNFQSELVTLDDIKDANGNIDQVKIQNFVNVDQLDPRSYDIPYDGRANDIPQAALDYAQQKADEIKQAKLVYVDFIVLDYYRNKVLKFENGRLSEPDDVWKMPEWANLEEKKYGNAKDSCVVDFIKNKYNKLYWDIKKLETITNGKKGVIIDTFLDFCKKNDIGYNFFSEQGKPLYQRSGDNGTIGAFFYNNHILPFVGGKPIRHSTQELEVKLVDDGEEKLKDFLSKRILPYDIKMDRITTKDIKKIKNHCLHVTSFVVDDIKYVCNSDYETCKEFLTVIGKSEHFYDNLRVTDLPELLEKIYKPKSDLRSFIPEMDQFKPPVLNWKTMNKIDYDNVKTIDHNKDFIEALYALPYLLVFDHRKDNIINNPIEINEKYIYLVEPVYDDGVKYWTTMIPETNIYPGYHLLKAKEFGCQFKLLQEWRAHHEPNIYRKIIDLMRKHLDNDSFKRAFVVTIGKWQRSFQIKSDLDFVGIYNYETTRTFDGYYHDLGQDCSAVYKEQKKYLHVRNRLPIVTQIYAMSRLTVVEKIREENISAENLAQIKVDAISYYGEYPKDLDPKKVGGWKKVEEFKELNVREKLDKIVPPKIIINPNPNTRILHKQYAGSGKTHYIINKLIPKLEKEEITYVVLVPTLKVLGDYKKKGVKNCYTIQSFANLGIIPDADYIIIDEIGFVGTSCHDFLYKLNKANKSFECFGDFKQLPPVGEVGTLDQQHYLEYMFNQINTRFSNFRNNFTRKYYDSLIYNASIDYLISQVRKWSEKDMMKAEYILCYRHKTKAKYNDIMLGKLGFKHWTDPGVKLVCNAHDLSVSDSYYASTDTFVKKGQGLYCRKECIVLESECTDTKKEIYRLKIKDSDGIIYEFLKKLSWLENRFKPAYAINIHQAQGTTLNSYYWAEDDNKFFEDESNMAYTIISRLRQEYKFNMEDYVFTFDEEFKKAKELGLI